MADSHPADPSDSPPDLTSTIIRDHAREQMVVREISEEHVRAVLGRPDEVLPVRAGRVVAQRMIPMGSPSKDYLYRVFVDVDRDPPEMVTAYRTSQIRKYRSRP